MATWWRPVDWPRSFVDWAPEMKRSCDSISPLVTFSRWFLDGNEHLVKTEACEMTPMYLSPLQVISLAVAFVARLKEFSRVNEAVWCDRHRWQIPMTQLWIEDVFKVWKCSSMWKSVFVSSDSAAGDLIGSMFSDEVVDLTTSSRWRFVVVAPFRLLRLKRAVVALVPNQRKGKGN